MPVVWLEARVGARDGLTLFCSGVEPCLGPTSRSDCPPACAPKPPSGKGGRERPFLSMLLVCK